MNWVFLQTAGSAICLHHLRMVDELIATLDQKNERTSQERRMNTRIYRTSANKRKSGSAERKG